MLRAGTGRLPELRPAEVCSARCLSVVGILTYFQSKPKPQVSACCLEDRPGNEAARRPNR